VVWCFFPLIAIPIYYASNSLSYWKCVLSKQ
jgi:hypothetical protein